MTSGTGFDCEYNRAACRFPNASKHNAQVDYHKSGPIACRVSNPALTPCDRSTVVGIPIAEKLALDYTGKLFQFAGEERASWYGSID